MPPQARSLHLPGPSMSCMHKPCQLHPAAPPAPSSALLAPSPRTSSSCSLCAGCTPLWLLGSPPWNSANPTWLNGAWTWILAATLLFPCPKARRSPFHSQDKEQHWRCAQSTGTALTAQGCLRGRNYARRTAQLTDTQHQPEPVVVCGAWRALTLQAMPRQCWHQHWPESWCPRGTQGKSGALCAHHRGLSPFAIQGFC